MTEERRKVLDMLATGKITPDEAGQLLDHLSGQAAAESTPDSGEAKASPRKLRYLRVVVDKPDRDNVNIRLPLKLVMTGMKLSALVPGKAGKQLSAQGIDLSHLGKLKGAELNEALAELDIDIETDKGDKVRVFCE